MESEDDYSAESDSNEEEQDARRIDQLNRVRAINEALENNRAANGG